MTIGLILLLTTLLRLWGIGFGLPYLYHADEPIVVNHALAYGASDLNPHFFNIPPLVSYALFGCYGVFFIIGKLMGWWSSAMQFAETFFRDPSSFYLLGRVVLGVFPAVLSIYFLMRWFKKMAFGSQWCHAAGLLFAVCFLHVSDAHYIYADIPLVLVCILFFIALCSGDMSSRVSHVKLGALLGLAAAVKYNGVFLVIPYLWLVARARPPFSRLGGSLCFAASGALLSFFVLNPYAFLDFHFFIQELAEQSAANQGVPFFHHLTYSLAEGIGWPIVLLALVGTIRAFLSRDMRREAVAVFCLAYYLLLWQKGQPYGRYVLPLIPFLIFLAVDAAKWFFLKNRFLKVVAVFFIFTAVIFNLTKAVYFNSIMSRRDVRTEAAQWIEKNIAAGSRIALDGTSFTPRLSFSCEQLNSKLDDLKGAGLGFESMHQKRLLLKLQECRKKSGYELYFLTDSPGSNPFLFAAPEISADLNALISNNIEYVLVVFDEKLRSELRREGELLFLWSPYHRENVPHEGYDPEIITGGPFTLKDLAARRTNGYPIELYRLNRKS